MIVLDNLVKVCISERVALVAIFIVYFLVLVDILL